MEAFLNRRIDLETYLVSSTVLCVFLFIRIAHVGIDIFLGYLIIAINTVAMLLLDRLLIHRNHAIVIGILGAVSLVASASSDTPIMSIMAQLTGICGFSIYFFSILTTMGVSTARWLEMYAPIAVFIAIYGIIRFLAYHTILHEPGDQRLRSIYEEPSFFVYLTLPALGFYFNEWLRTRRYGLELGILLVAYALAEAGLGFIGIFLMAFFAFLPRLSFTGFLGFIVAACGAATGLFFISENVRRRVVDTVHGIAQSDLSGVNESTFAILTNAYVTFQSFLSHPLIGVGLGGYQFAYTRYIGGLSGLDPTMMDLNMYDASSMILRTAAELGIFGLICLLAFFIFFSRVRGEKFVEVRNIILPYLIVRATRLGAYFTVELFFFIGLYVLNYVQSRGQFREKRIAAPAAAIIDRPAPEGPV